MVNIEKYFGLVHALSNINVEVGCNGIVGLIGDNGAGKSTMVKILTGVYRPTSGELYVAGRKVDLNSYNVKTAHSYGIETVYQDKSSARSRPFGATSSSDARSPTALASSTSKKKSASPRRSCSTPSAFVAEASRWTRP